MAFDTQNQRRSVVALGLSIFGSLPAAVGAFAADGAAMRCGKYAFEVAEVADIWTPRATDATTWTPRATSSATWTKRTTASTTWTNRS